MAGHIPDSKSVHYNTERWLIDDIEAALDGEKITLDPCSNEWSVVRATREYRIERGEDGLKLPWYGNTFCNPPFGKDKVSKTSINDWIEKAFNEAARPENIMANIILLIPAYVDRKIWHSLIFKNADEIFFFKGRLNFGDKGNWGTDSAPMPMSLVYFGTRHMPFSNHMPEKGYGFKP